MGNDNRIPGFETPYFVLEYKSTPFKGSRPRFEPVDSATTSKEVISNLLAQTWEVRREVMWYGKDGESLYSVAVWDGPPGEGGVLLGVVSAEIWLELVGDNASIEAEDD